MARSHPIRRLIDGRPDDPGRRIARRTTLLMVPAIVGANCTGAIVVFTLLAFVLPLPDVENQDVGFSLLLAVIVSVTTLLGAITTGAMAYLLAERIMRATAARALASGVPEKPVLPGVTTRALLAWALGSGVPLVGLFAVAVVALAGVDIRPP